MLPTTELSDSDFQYTILHELTHYKRMDMFYKWLVQLTICIQWFNPFVYLMEREINRACELACDEAVIRKLDTNSQRAYGDTLLNALSIGGSYKDSLASVTLTESKELLKERLDAIMSYKKKTKLIGFATFLISCLLLCGFAFTGAYAASQSNIYIPLQPNSVNGTPAEVESGETKETLGTNQAISYVIECVSEDILVKQEGSEFKVELDPKSQSSYRIEIILISLLVIEIIGIINGI